MKTLKLALGLVGFIVVATVVGALANSRIPKTTRLIVTVDKCNYTVQGDLKIKKNQNVSLTAASKQGGEFHVHGYDLEKDLEPGKAETFNFRTVQTGQFEIEQHGCEAHVVMTVQ